MSIYELKRLNKANGGHFFDRGSMAMFCDTLRNFKVEKVSEDRVHVTRKRKVKTYGNGSWFFNSKTGRMI